MKKTLLIIVLLTGIQVLAQKIEPITLTVSGQGKTKEEAKSYALRSALEQAFGVYISSKTEVLDDKLTKDEIVSITNGSIDKYTIVSEVQLPNGNFAITLTAKVSIAKLTDFCSAKGITVEVNGATFATNIRLQKLNEDAEYKATLSLCEASWNILSNSVDFGLEVGKPEVNQENTDDYILPITVLYSSNKNKELFAEYFTKTLQFMSMKEEELKEYISLKKPIEYFIINDKVVVKLRNPKSALALKNLLIKSNRFIMDFIVYSDVDSLIIKKWEPNANLEYTFCNNCYAYPIPLNRWSFASENPYIRDMVKDMPIILAGPKYKGVGLPVFGIGLDAIVGILKNTKSNYNVFYNKLFTSEYNNTIINDASDGGILSYWYQSNLTEINPTVSNVTYIDFKVKSTGKLSIKHVLKLSQLERLTNYRIKPLKSFGF